MDDVLINERSALSRYSSISISRSCCRLCDLSCRIVSEFRQRFAAANIDLRVEEEWRGAQQTDVDQLTTDPEDRCGRSMITVPGLRVYNI